MPTIITPLVPYIAIADVPELRPGNLDFTLSFKFRLDISSGVISSLLPGNYGPFLGFHKNLYYINKSGTNTLKLVVYSGYMPDAINRLFMRGNFSYSPGSGVIAPFSATILPGTVYTVSFAKTSTPKTSNNHTLSLTVNGTPTSQTLSGRHKSMLLSNNGYALYAGIYDTAHLFPGDLGSTVSLVLDDLSLSLKSLQETGIKYRFRVDSFQDASFTDGPAITPTTAPPAPSPSPSPSPGPSPSPPPAPFPTGLTLFALGTNAGSAYSQDGGATWSTFNVPTANWLALRKTSTYYVLAGGSALTEPNLVTSTDLQSWFASNDLNVISAGASIKANYNSIAISPSITIAANNTSSGGATALLVSYDNGYSWGRIGSPFYCFFLYYDTVTSLFIMCRFGLISTNDGSDLTIWPTRSSTSGTWVRVARANANLVAVNSAGTTWQRSPDALTWTPFTAPSTATVLAGNSTGVFVAGGAHSALMTSINDGVTWTSSPTLPYAYTVMKSVIWTGSEFIACVTVGSAYKLIASSDGLTWTDRGTAPVVVNQLQSITV